MEFKSYTFSLSCRYVNPKIENGTVHPALTVVEEVRPVTCVHELSEVNCSLTFSTWFEVERSPDRQQELFFGMSGFKGWFGTPRDKCLVLDTCVSSFVLLVIETKRLQFGVSYLPCKRLLAL